jgi:hypothetical protein
MKHHQMTPHNSVARRPSTGGGKQSKHSSRGLTVRSLQTTPVINATAAEMLSRQQKGLTKEEEDYISVEVYRVAKLIRQRRLREMGSAWAEWDELDMAAAAEDCSFS